MKHKPLLDEFTKNGFDHVRVKTGDWTIKNNKPESWQIWKRQGKTHKTAHFEVVRVTKHDGYTLGGVFIEPAEVYPSASSWGTDGFTCPDFSKAFVKWRELA